MSIAVLREFPEYREFRRKEDSPAEPAASVEVEQTKAPEEVIEAAAALLRLELTQAILDALMRASPPYFEKVDVDLLLAMWYGGAMSDAGKVVGRSGDGGIDGTIREDKLGLDVIYIQAKKWERTVGRPDVQGFAGSLDGVRSKRGVMITTSTFSAERAPVRGADREEGRPDRRRGTCPAHDRPRGRRRRAGEVRDQEARCRLLHRGVRICHSTVAPTAIGLDCWQSGNETEFGPTNKLRSGGCGPTAYVRTPFLSTPNWSPPGRGSTPPSPP